MPLSSPAARLRGRGGELLPARRPCLRPGCGTLISAHAPATDRFCWSCAPRVDDEPPYDPSLYCSRGHLRSEFEVRRRNGSKDKPECSECHRLRNLKRDRSAAGKAAHELERQRRDPEPVDPGREPEPVDRGRRPQERAA